MKPSRAAILPFRRSHVRACEKIVAASDPWKRLNERIDFLSLMRGKQTAVRGFVCSIGDDIAGFVLFSPGPVFARGGYLRAIGVAPEFRGRGVGRKLLQRAERETSRSSPHLYLCVSSFNRRAQAFYRSCGYAKVGRVPGLVVPGFSEYIYWKRLCSR